MKIVFLLATRNFGGAQRSTLELAKRLSENHAVKIIEIECLDISFKNAIVASELPYEVYPKDLSKLSFARKIRSWFKWSKWIKKEIGDWKPDVVLVKDVKTLSLLRKNNGYEIYFHARAWYATYQISFFKRFAFNILKPKFIAVSEATRHAIFNSQLAKIEKISVVPNALNIIPKNISHKFDDKYNKGLRILHAGGYIPSKGQHISIEVAKQLKKLGIPFKMTLIGFVYKSKKSSNYFNKLKNLVSEYDLNDNVKLLTSENNITELYLNSNILIHPSDTEGLPRVVMEAMGYGLIVIANPVGGIIDLVKNNYTGFIADYNDISSYLFFLNRLYEDKSLIHLMSKRSIDIITNNYTVENQLMAFERALQK